MNTMSFLLRKRAITHVTCPGCGVACDVATPPGDFKVDFRCGRAECQQYVQPYVPNDEHAMYFVTKDANGDRVKHKIGSDCDPFSLEMYQRLNVGNAATSEEIRDAYNERRLALNPPEDPNLCLQNAAETAQVEEAYRLLSDPISRRSYNKYGLTPDLVIVGEGGLDHLSVVLNHLLGDGKFYDLIGAPILLENILEERENPIMLRAHITHVNVGLPEKFFKDIAVTHIAGLLNQKLYRYDPEHVADFRNVITLEAEQLRIHRNGLKILHAVGNVYSKVGKIYAVMYSNANRFKCFLSSSQVNLQLLFHFNQFEFELAKTMANYKNAVAEEQVYLSKRWRTISCRQQLRERCLRLLNEICWRRCKLECEIRILLACFLIFEVDREVVGKLGIETLERRATALKIIGEIYKKQI